MEKIRVIIADDEPRICRLILSLIKWDKLGMEVVGTAHNGVEALDLIQAKAPHIVITDVRMPGYDGLEMIERAKQSNPDLEFILISGYEEFAYAQKAMSFGVKDYLCKPISRDKLQLALERAQEEVRSRERQRILEQEYANLHKDEERIRAAFLRDLVLLGPGDLVTGDIEEINQQYHFRFQTGMFRITIIQIDPVDAAGPKMKGVGEQQAALLESALRKRLMKWRLRSSTAISMSW